VAEFVYGELAEPRGANVVILCGPGNNGGDGLVAARHLINAGVRVTVIRAFPREKYAADAATNLHILERLCAAANLNDAILDASTPDGLAATRAAIGGGTVLVDALLGTGASGAPRGVLAELIRLANSASGRRIAVDIPSGLDADLGVPAEPCFRADATVTFVAEKTGFRTSAAQAMLGRVVVVDIGVSRQLLPRSTAIG
jgi:NAD(P)H-hydrate epimerase